MDISGYPFQGPYSDTSQLEDRSGIYVILDYEHGQRPRVIDVGESAQVKSRVEGHDRKDCWTRNSRGTLKYASITPRMFNLQEGEISKRRSGNNISRLVATDKNCCCCPGCFLDTSL